MKIRRKRLNELINDEADCRTAPATPGLLNIVIFMSEESISRRKIIVWNISKRSTNYRFLDLDFDVSSYFCTIQNQNRLLLFPVN